MSRADGSWTSFFDRVLDAVYPRKCPLCGLMSEASPCASCLDAFVPSEPRFKVPEDEPLSYRATLFRYEGRAAQAVRRLKYSRSTSLVEAMSQEMAKAVEGHGLKPDMVVPVPIHWSRRCTRGFNQSELLCEALSPDAGALRRIRRTRPQVGLSREERVRNLEGAFRADARVAGKHVLLVDDVLTSGQTARECARALYVAGASEVGVLAFCGDA